MGQGDNDCFKCRKMSQWGFTGISMYLSYNYFLHKPYTTKIESFIRLCPALFFMGAAVYSYYQADLIKQKILAKAEENSIKYNDD